MDKNINIRKKELKKQISLLEKELLILEQKEERNIVENYRLKIGKCYKIDNNTLFKVNEINNIYNSTGIMLLLDDKEEFFFIRNNHHVDLKRLTDEVSEKEFQEKLNNILSYIK